MVTDDVRLNEGIKALLAEYARSVLIHTDWQEYAARECYEAVEDEFLELRRAFLAGDIRGTHGMALESLQLAVVALKMHIYYGGSDPQGVTHA